MTREQRRNLVLTVVALSLMVMALFFLPILRKLT
jgi:hypothetical protein